VTGEEVIVRCSARPILLNGRTLGAVAINTDITAEKRAEARLARSNADLQQFAYATSHDLQEPLRTMTSYSQMLLRRYGGKLGPDADMFLGFIVSAAGRMRSLIDSLLAYSQVVNVDAQIPAPVSLDGVLQDTIRNLQTVIQESRAKITSGTLPTIQADQLQMIQLFQNLLSNAIKYRKMEEPLEIHVSAEGREREWVISVRDNGIGIEPQHAERIFGVFKRLHGGEIPGTGIGLAIARRIVEKRGGRIWVESEAGRESTFLFTWPR
jgi:light-regulated signal transduction histidine kinase (bacteriophytochrome)